ncbi:MAG: hypothetical protein HY647_07755 [Acidobacteria bacterium]|nr:hypothetical protein [Acidobacteriota bacterium]
MSLSESTISNKVRDPRSPPAVVGGVGNRFVLMVFIALCVEIGIFLCLFPWSEIWQSNFLLGQYPWLRPIYMSPYLRGAISGLGVVNLWLGISQAWNFRQLVSGSRNAGE